MIDVKQLFPLEGPEDILQLFRKQLEGGHPDLSLLSIVIGYVENQLTSQENQQSFPVIEWSMVDQLYKKFQTILTTALDISKSSLKNSQTRPTRETIKRVSDIIWNSLIRSTYKDRAHLQSLYSYLYASKLDCFGVAFAVVAACQLLGYQGVNLAISEDHAWVVRALDNGRTETIEVTWHGKEDKRGESISAGVSSQSWIYLSGHSVNCNRFMEVTAMVLSMNPSLNLTTACLEMTSLQQQLLWLLYDKGHLDTYPMALSTLGELEEFSPSPESDKRISSLELYNRSVEVARKWYSDAHVYPYVSIGSYYYRKAMYKESFACWANAGDVIRRYIYSKDDEEVYKELVDIANEQIPSLMKAESSGHSANSILRDANCFARLLKFYDGICMWEEGSVTPILHIGWAKPLLSTIGKFDYEIRSQVIIEPAEDDEAIPTTSSCSTNVKLDPKKDATLESKSEDPSGESNGTVPSDEPQIPIRPVVKLFSQKMKGLKNLLLAEKLNTQAILLQVTAQSQVGGGKKSGRGGSSHSNDSITTGDKATGGASATGTGSQKDTQTNNQNAMNNSAIGGSCNSSADGGGGGGSVGRPKRPRRE